MPRRGGRVRRPLVGLALSLACVGPAGCGADRAPHDAAPPVAGPRPPHGAFAATVERVVDGDTFVARRDGRRLRVRLIGVDAPESVRPGAPVDCYGPEAARLLRDLLPRGVALRAAYQGEPRQDRFGRELWDVWLGDGRFLQAELVRAGAAGPHPYPPQTRYADLLDGLDVRARRAGAGRYGACPAQ